MNLALTLLLTSMLFAGDVSTEERLLATIPEGVDYETTTTTAPDGSKHTREFNVTWSPDGLQVASVGYRIGEGFPIVGEKRLKTYTFVEGPYFGPTGDQVVFRVGNSKRNRTEDWWLIDGEGKKLLKEDFIASPTISPNGKRIAVWTQPGMKLAKDGYYKPGSMLLAIGEVDKKGKWKFKTGKKYRGDAGSSRHVFTEDSQTCASLTAHDSTWFVLLSEGKKQRRFDKETHSFVTSFAISPDAKQLALSIWDTTRKMADGAFGTINVIQFGKARWGSEYDSAGLPVFSPNGEHLAYKVKRGEKMGIALDGDTAVKPDRDFVFKPVFAPNSERFGYVACEGSEVNPGFAMAPQGEYSVKGGEQMLVIESVDRKAEPEILGKGFAMIRNLTWDAASERVAFSAQTEDGWIVVCGETKSQPHDQVGRPRFSADGKQLCYGARDERELWWKVLDLE